VKTVGKPSKMTTKAQEIPRQPIVFSRYSTITFPFFNDLHPLCKGQTDFFRSMVFNISQALFQARCITFGSRRKLLISYQFFDVDVPTLTAKK
jgi:hypothetical protein